MTTFGFSRFHRNGRHLHQVRPFLTLANNADETLSCTCAFVKKKKRAYFSASASAISILPGQSVSSFAPGYLNEGAADRFTHFALNFKSVPLGSIKDDIWSDIVDAVVAWIRIGGGFSADSAERLLDRLLYEYAVSASGEIGTTGYSCQSPFSCKWSGQESTLLDLQRALFYCWEKVAFDSQTSSILALNRTEIAFYRLYDLSIQFERRIGQIPATTNVKFPIDEFVILVKGCLNFQNEQLGAERACEHLLKLCISGENDSVYLFETADYSKAVSALFEECMVRLLSIDRAEAKSVHLLEKMSDLIESGRWPHLKLPEAAERILLESTLKRTENSPRSEKQRAPSPFELEGMEKRLIDVLQTADEKGGDDIEDLIRRYIKMDPSISLVFALVEYYIRLQNVENASYWLQKLDRSLLNNASELIDNVVQLWSKEEGLRIAWRADELLRMITSHCHDYKDNTVPVNESTLNTMIEIWSRSDNWAASRKILDWFSDMIAWKKKPDVPTLKTVLEAVRKEKAGLSLQLVSLELLEIWDTLAHSDKVELSEAVMAAASAAGGETAKSLAKLLDRFRDDNIQPTGVLYRASLNALRVGISTPAEVMNIVDSFENDGEVVTDLSLYLLALRTLFRFDDEGFPKFHRLCGRVLDLIKENVHNFESNSVRDVLDNIVGMYVHRKRFTEAKHFVDKAEHMLMTKNLADGEEKTSLIPLGCYKRMIVRKWYSAKMSLEIAEIFEHLLALYNSGYSDLQPDCETFTGYIRACAAAGKDVKKPYKYMIGLYKSTGNDSLKPNVEILNTVLLSFSREPVSLHPGMKSVSAFFGMLNLGVHPETKSVNFVLHNLVKGPNRRSFEYVTNFLKKIDRFGFRYVPDSFTLHYIMDACGQVQHSQREDALKKCLSTFRSIRNNGFLGSTTYGILSKNISKLLTKGTQADNIMGSLLTLCCEDGLLTTEVKDNFKTIMSQTAWKMKYESNLSDNGNEPPEWKLNV